MSKEEGGSDREAVTPTKLIAKLNLPVGIAANRVAAVLRVKEKSPH